MKGKTKIDFLTENDDEFRNIYGTGTAHQMTQQG